MKRTVSLRLALCLDHCLRYDAMMADLDFNLLAALDVLLAEGSVTGAARVLGLSPSAMSRTLARLRVATGDPLLVRAGRALVPTPRAAELRGRVHDLARATRSVLSPRSDRLDIALLERTFTLRANEGFIERFSAPLVAAICGVAPGVRLRFAPKPQKDANPLREGRIDLEIGVRGASAPEVRTQMLFRDDFVGVARVGHPLLVGIMTPARYAACQHVAASRRGLFTGPVDAALAALGLARSVVVVVPGFSDAMRIARDADLVALVPRSCLDGAEPSSDGLTQFDLPVETPRIAISAMWHPRMDSDPAHRWFRDIVVAQCRAGAHRSRS